MPEQLVLEYRRMLQRRGAKSDISDLKHAEIALVEDEESLYYGVGNNAFKVLDERTIIDSFDSDNSDKSLSANKGKELNSRIEALTTTVANYVNSIDNIVNTKQDIIVHKGLTAPNDTELIWLKTN